MSVAREVKHQASDWTGDSGGDRVGRCTHPVHGHTSSEGGTPNMMVTEDGGWYCYSHSTGGGIFEWIAVETGIIDCRDLDRGDGLSGEAFRDALEVAADRAGVELSSGGGPEDYEEAMADNNSSEEQAALLALDQAIDILHDNLDAMIGDQNVRGVIKDRRPFTDEMIDEARIGYFDDQAQAELMEALPTNALQMIGFMDENESAHIRNRIVYPYLDDRGRARYWAARATDASAIEAAKYMKPCNDTTVLEQPIHVYAGSDSRPGEPVWMVEGIQDAMALGEHGGVKAITSVSTNPSSKQLCQLMEQAEDRGSAVVCFDPDDGGQGDAIDMALNLMSAGVQTSMANLPEGMDPNDYFLDGGKFDDLDVRPAAEAIIEARGDSDSLIRRILGTTEPETARAERLVDTLSKETPIGKSVLRDMLSEEQRYEEQMGWRQPEKIRKPEGVNMYWEFVYADGVEIRMERLVGYGVEAEFANKYAAHYNYIPPFDDESLTEMANRWMNEKDVDVVPVSDLSQEGRCRELVLSEIQEAAAVPSKDHLGTVGVDEIIVSEEDGEVRVQSTTMEEWVEDRDVSLRRLSEYLEPFMDEGTRRVRVDGKRVSMWPLRKNAIEEAGFEVPEPKEDEDREDESNPEADDL